MVLPGLCPSSNCLYTKSKFTMLRPLKGEVGYELAASKNSDLSSSGFLQQQFKNVVHVICELINTVVMPFGCIYWWFVYNVIKNMNMQTMINLPKMLIQPTRPCNLSVPNLKSFGPMKTNL